MNTQAVVARLAKPGFEFDVPWMYRDRAEAGNVTAGRGHKVISANEAVKMPWMVGDRMATESEIRIDFASVEQAPAGKLYTFYAPLTIVRLTPAGIEHVCAADVEFFEPHLAKAIPCWNDLPESVQEGLFDIAFDCGVEGLVRGFPKLMEAIEQKEWAQAAAESHRGAPIGDYRNNEIARLFRLAAA